MTQCHSAPENFLMGSPASVGGVLRLFFRLHGGGELRVDLREIRLHVQAPVVRAGPDMEGVADVYKLPLEKAFVVQPELFRGAEGGFCADRDRARVGHGGFVLHVQVHHGRVNAPLVHGGVAEAQLLEVVHPGDLVPDGIDRVVDDAHGVAVGIPDGDGDFADHVILPEKPPPSTGQRRLHVGQASLFLR